MNKRFAPFMAFALISLLAVGCTGGTTADVKSADQVDVEKKGEKRVIEDFAVIPAPEGVKTGTPGPDGKM